MVNLFIPEKLFWISGLKIGCIIFNSNSVSINVLNCHHSALATFQWQIWPKLITILKYSQKIMFINFLCPGQEHDHFQHIQWDPKHSTYSRTWSDGRRPGEETQSAKCEELCVVCTAHKCTSCHLRLLTVMQINEKLLVQWKVAVFWIFFHRFLSLPIVYNTNACACKVNNINILSISLKQFDDSYSFTWHLRKMLKSGFGWFMKLKV